MEFSPFKNRRTLSPDSSVTVHEYDMSEKALGVGVAEINGRYPASGFVKNTACKQMVYVVEGAGDLHRPDQSIALTKGDVVLLDANELFAWEGCLNLFMANAPRFDPKQYVWAEE